MSRPGRVLVVTGTSTGVGKTVVTAALSSVVAARGEQVVVVKPVQTGIADGDCDAEEVHRLTGCAVQEHAALDEPLAPETAACRAGVTLPTVAEHADRLKVHTEFYDTVVVEGDPELFNQYGVILVNPDRHPAVKAEAGQAFIDWLTGDEGQAAIANYRVDGQQLFFPNADMTGDRS